MTFDEIKSAVAADREGKWTAQTVIAKIEEATRACPVCNKLREEKK